MRLVNFWNESNYVIIVFFAGIASGAILYVVIFEVIHREKSRYDTVPGLLQFGAILFGFVIVVLVKILGKKQLETYIFSFSKKINQFPMFFRWRSHHRFWWFEPKFCQQCHWIATPNYWLKISYISIFYSILIFCFFLRN